MMIKQRTIELSVGFFIILAVLCMSILFFKVSGGDEVSFPNGYYTVTATFSNVGTLKTKSKVIIAGVAMGRVVDINFDKRSFNAKVKINIDRNIDNIPVDSEFKIVTAGLLGDKYITIVPGFDTRNFLVDGASIGAENTESALVLEDLIGKFLTSSVS